MKEEFVVYQSKGKQLLLIFLAVIMTGVSVFLIFPQDLDVGFLGGSGSFLIPLVGIIGTIFFCFCLGYSIKLLLLGKPVVILTKEGFYDYSSALATKDRLIPWKDVTDIGVFNVSGQNFISIRLENREEFLASLSTITRKAAQANLKLGSYEINITMQSAKNVSLEELLMHMAEYCDAAK